MSFLNSTTARADAADMIGQGFEEWASAAIKVGLADDMEEAGELYESDKGEVTSTLIDMVLSYWSRNGGYVIRDENKTRRIYFGNDPALDEGE